MGKNKSKRLQAIVKDTSNEPIEKMKALTGPFDTKYDKNLGLELIYNKNLDGNIHHSEIIGLKFDLIEEIVNNCELGDHVYLKLEESENDTNMYKIMAYPIEDEKNPIPLATIRYAHTKVPGRGRVSVLKTVKRQKLINLVDSSSKAKFKYNVNKVCDATYEKFNMPESDVKPKNIKAKEFDPFDENLIAEIKEYRGQ